MRIPVGGNIGKILDHKATRFAIGTIMGGVSSKLAGGNFWQGTAVAGMVTLFNHMMHDGGPPADFKGDSYEDPETGDIYNRKNNGAFERVYADGTVDHERHIQEVIIPPSGANLFRNFMGKISNFGMGMTVTGMVLTMTGFGAEAGIVLIQAGNVISLGADAMIIGSYIYEGKWSKTGVEVGKFVVEDLVTRGTGKLVKPVGRGINRMWAEQINGTAASKISIPALESEIKTVN